MKRIAVVLVLCLAMASCGGAEVRGLRKGIEVAAVSLKATDEVMTRALSVIEPTIADQVRDVCKEEMECLELYRKQLEPYTYATETLATAITALKVLESSVDLYEDAGDAASMAILIEDLNTLAYILTDLIAQLKGLGVAVPNELESALSRLEAIMGGLNHGIR